jgi:muconate cycloisomerase
MKINSFETVCPTIPLKPAYHMITALGQHIDSTYVLLRLTTDNGLEGFGEATVAVRWSGETPVGAVDVIQHVLMPAIIDREVEDLEGIADQLDRVCIGNWFAKSAIEMACWDLLGKQQQKPVYELLGGAVRPLTIRSRFSMGAYDVPRARQRAEQLVELGFTTIKVKVGTDPVEDVARVRAVREVIGPELAIVIDANCGWSADTAIECLAKLSDCNVGLVEQPTPKGDFQALARVRREAGVRILADDICFNLTDAQELIHNQCCDAISVYPGKNGGIIRSRQIVDLAAEHGIPCSIGSNLEYDVATAAMGQLVVSHPNMKIEEIPGDLLGPDYHQQSVAINPIAIEGPLTTLNQTPGLGVQLDWESLRNQCDQ